MSHRVAQRIGFVLVLFMAVCCSTVQSHGADTLECPEIGSGSVPDLIGDAAGGGLFTTESRVDLANEINEAITNRQPKYLIVRRAERADCCLLSRSGPQARAHRRREMGSHAPVRKYAGTADRG